jgi:hypothetical protein
VLNDQANTGEKLRFGKLLQNLVEILPLGKAVWNFCVTEGMAMRRGWISFLTIAVASFVVGRCSSSKKELTTTQNQPITVSSVSQSGGITAGTFNNIVSPPRTLSPDFEAQLKRIMAGRKKAKVLSSVGDGEAGQFAGQIEKFLRSNGYEIVEVAQVVTVPAVIGVEANYEGEDTVRFVVGAKP